MARIIVIGASSGGLAPLRKLISCFPSDLEAALFVVMHVPPTAKSILPELLSRAGLLRAIHVYDRIHIERGIIHVAPPDKHLVIENGFVTASSGPPENRFRPSIDTLFRSAAQTYGPLVIGILLSGNLADGVAGLTMIKKKGGTVFVQDPREAAFPSLPLNAIRKDLVDHVLSIPEIASKILTFVVQGVKMTGPNCRSIKGCVTKTSIL